MEIKSWILSIVFLQGAIGLRLSTQGPKKKHSPGKSENSPKKKKTQENQCTAQFDTHLTNLRKAGFKIPGNGEHDPSDGVEGGSSHPEFEYLVNLAQNLKPGAVVCQTGFNYGSSAYAFLCGGVAKVLSWDLGPTNHNYVTEANELIATQFPGKHELIIGNSIETLQGVSTKISERCDMIFIDGGHTFDVAQSDIANFQSVAKPGALLVVDDCMYHRGDEVGIRDNSAAEVSAAFALAVDKELLTVNGSVSLNDQKSSRQVCLGGYVDQQQQK